MSAVYRLVKFVVKENGKGEEIEFGNGDKPYLVAVTGVEKTAQATSEWSITEVNQRTSYEFFEIYNSSDKPLNLNNYTFSYITPIYTDYANATVGIGYKDTPLNSLTESAVIPAGGVAVIWAKNDGIDITAEQEKAFNDYYGLTGGEALVAGKNLFKFNTAMPDTNGKSGLNSRGFAIKDSEGKIVTQVFFNLNPDGTQLPKNSSLIPSNNGTSINYLPASQPVEALDGTVWQKMYHYNMYQCSPGKVADFQVAAAPYDVQLDPPTLTMEEDHTHTFIEGQEGVFDLRELFSIDWNDYSAENAEISYSVTKGEESIPVDGETLTIPETSGTYRFTVTISSADGYFADVSDSVTFTMEMQKYREPPQVSIGQLNATVYVGRDQAMVDLRGLYELAAGEFDEGEIEVRYSVTVPGRDIQVYGHSINAVEGTYSVTVTLHSPESLFEDVVSDTITLNVVKQPPEIVFEDGKGDPIDGSALNFVLTAAGQTADVNSFFTVNGNAYVLSQYQVSFTLTLGGNAVETDNGVFAAQPGTYTLSIRVSPVSEGDFVAVTRELSITFIRQAPALSAEDAAQAPNGGQIDLSRFITLSLGAYGEDAVTVVYSVTRGGETVAVNGGYIDAQSGVYTVTVTVKSTDGSFADISDTFTLTVEGTQEGGDTDGCGSSVSGGIACGAAVALLALCAVMIRKKRI